MGIASGTLNILKGTKNRIASGLARDGKTLFGIGQAGAGAVTKTAGAVASSGGVVRKTAGAIVEAGFSPISTAIKASKIGVGVAGVGTVAYMLTRGGRKPATVNENLDLDESAFTSQVQTQPLNFVPQQAPEPTLMGQPLVKNGQFGSKVLQERGGQQAQGFAGAPPLDLHADNVSLSGGDLAPVR